jgi:hypothetical protein
MTRNFHDEAQELIALGNALTEPQQTWLRGHLEECADCRSYAEACSRVSVAVRSLPVAADARLVRATQMRVRFHASRMRETRARMWMVGVACLGVGLSAAVTAPLLWRLFAWLGERAGVSDMVWQAAYAGFWIVPVLVVSALLLARGTHLADHRE